MDEETGTSQNETNTEVYIWMKWRSTTEVEQCSLITVRLLSWGPGAVIEFSHIPVRGDGASQRTDTGTCC